MFTSICISISICTHSHTPKSTVTHMMNNLPNIAPQDRQSQGKNDEGNEFVFYVTECILGAPQ